jgi:hypothetical protein
MGAMKAMTDMRMNGLALYPIVVKPYIDDPT